jgi:hypothetical protein
MHLLKLKLSWGLSNKKLTSQGFLSQKPCDATLPLLHYIFSLRSGAQTFRKKRLYQPVSAMGGGCVLGNANRLHTMITNDDIYQGIIIHRILIKPQGKIISKLKRPNQDKVNNTLTRFGQLYVMQSVLMLQPHDDSSHDLQQLH